MNYRGMNLRLSVQGQVETCYVCSAHYGNVIEVVPVTPGMETVCLPPLTLDVDAWIGAAYHRTILEDIKARYLAVVRTLETEVELLGCLLLCSSTRLAKLSNAQQNLERLQSLDGDQPIARGDLTPVNRAHAVAIVEIVDEMDRPDYVGELVFIEIPRPFDDGISGEYIILQQSDDSLYGVGTHSATDACLVRIPLCSNDCSLTVLDSYKDDDFIREFARRLKDSPGECNETVAWQLRRMVNACDYDCCGKSCVAAR